MGYQVIVEFYMPIIETILEGCLLVGGIAICVSGVILICCIIALVIDLIKIIKEKFE